MNYQVMMDEEIKKIEKEKEVPTLLLHSCCAPCSSYTLEYLSNYFKITVFYYNPNISPFLEYQKRKDEEKKFISEFPSKNKISFIEGEYENDIYETIVDGKREEKEGGSRCYLCYQLRLRKTALLAKKLGFDYFTTTLSISPYKNAKWLNEIGEALEKEVGISYLHADLKKKGGYQRSIELSKIYGLYRQDYCGCVYSKRENDLKKEKE